MEIVIIAMLLVIASLIIFETYAYFSLKKSKIDSQFILNIKKIKSRNTVRQKILREVLKHYMRLDCNLGLVMKENTTVFRFKKKKNIRSKTKSVKIGNFFEIETDNHGFICNSEGQIRDYKEIVNDDKIYRIVVTGNSVTAGSGVSKSANTWPALIEQRINQDISQLFGGRYEKAVVINSSALGHKMSHELRRLQDDLVFLKPHLVISFSGCYANYDYIGSPTFDANHDVQNNLNQQLNYSPLLWQDILFPSTITLLKNKAIKKNKNDEYLQIASHQVTSTKIKQVKGVCDASNADFIFCLQPIMGYGNKKLSKAEERLKQDFEKYFFDMNWDNYNKKVISYLENLTSTLNEDYQYNLTGVFDLTEKTVFSDPRHQNDLGHKIISENIYQICKENFYNFDNKKYDFDNIKAEKLTNEHA